MILLIANIIKSVNVLKIFIYLLFLLLMKIGNLVFLIID